MGLWYEEKGMKSSTHLLFIIQLSSLSMSFVIVIELRQNKNTFMHLPIFCSGAPISAACTSRVYEDISDAQNLISVFIFATVMPVPYFLLIEQIWYIHSFKPSLTRITTFKRYNFKSTWKGHWSLKPSSIGHWSHDKTKCVHARCSCVLVRCSYLMTPHLDFTRVVCLIRYSKILLMFVSFYFSLMSTTGKSNLHECISHLSPKICWYFFLINRCVYKIYTFFQLPKIFRNQFLKK